MNMTVRTITAEQYRTLEGGDFDEAFIDRGCTREIWDVDINRNENEMVVLTGAWGSLPVDPDKQIYVR